MPQHRAIALCALLLGAAALLGCHIERNPDEYSHHRHHGPLEIPLNRLVIDSVEPGSPDKKYFTVTQPGPIHIHVHFENPKANVRVMIASSAGQDLTENPTPDSTPQTRRFAFQATPGDYFIQIHADDLNTDYTVEVISKEG